MNLKNIENLFNQYQQEGNQLQNSLKEKKEAFDNLQREMAELEYAITLKNGSIQALQTLYSQIQKEEAATEETSENKVEETSTEK